jgi:hypothetical protein
MNTVIADMNRLRPAPTVAREATSWAANLVVTLAVVGAFWVFEGPVTVVAIAAGVVMALLTARLAWRAAQGDVEGPSAAI